MQDSKDFKSSQIVVVGANRPAVPNTSALFNYNITGIDFVPDGVFIKTIYLFDDGLVAPQDTYIVNSNMINELKICAVSDGVVGLTPNIYIPLGKPINGTYTFFLTNLDNSATPGAVVVLNTNFMFSMTMQFVKY